MIAIRERKVLSLSGLSSGQILSGFDPFVVVLDVQLFMTMV
jgi:hypothetical protein